VIPLMLFALVLASLPGDPRHRGLRDGPRDDVVATSTRFG